MFALTVCTYLPEQLALYFGKIQWEGLYVHINMSDKNYL